LTGVVSGALVPHAPVLLPEAVGGEVAARTETVRSALRSLSFSDADLVVLLSPHAPQTGVYTSVTGSLAGFSIPGVELSRSSDPGAIGALAELWNKPVQEGPVDHGTLIPLSLLNTGEAEIVAAGLREVREEDVRSFEIAVADGLSFAEAVGGLARKRRIGVVVSAHTSSALSPRAPLTERVEAKPAEGHVLRALDKDPSELSEVLEELWRLGGSCSPGTLTAYAAVFGGGRSEVIAYEHPFGVGYVVARPL
jgi:aromatic ring-opening dioxygenase LigB subunit